MRVSWYGLVVWLMLEEVEVEVGDGKEKVVVL